MDPDAHLVAVDRELAAFVAAVADGPLDADVPTCPDWDVDGLAAHVGFLCGFWAHLFCDAAGVERTPFAPEPGPEGRLAWLEGLAASLLPLLHDTPAEAEVWTWYEPDQTARFWRRRIAHELAVHRGDAQSARGTVQPIEADLAVDGIDELLLLASTEGPSGPRGVPGSGETLHVHGTDHDGAEWLVTLAPGGLEVEQVHAKGDLALRGAVSDLELLLYQRPPLGAIERFGDEAALAAFHRAFTFG